MQQMRPHDALALAPDLLGDTLRSEVLGVGDQVETLEAEIVERPACQRAERDRADALPARPGGDPVPDRPPVALRVDAHPDRSDDRVVDGDRERVVGCPWNLAAHEAERTFLGVRRGTDRNPARYLGVVAGAYEHGDVLLGPRTKHEITVAELHGSSLGRPHGSSVSATAAAKRPRFRDSRDQEPALAGY